jgi:hypothetical protein
MDDGDVKDTTRTSMVKDEKKRKRGCSARDSILLVAFFSADGPWEIVDERPVGKFDKLRHSLAN